MKKASCKRMAIALLMSVLLALVFVFAASADECTGEHSYVNGICTVSGCGAYQPATLNGGVYEIGNAGQLFWFAQKVNNENPNINGKLTDNIELNPGYTFTFNPDTGLVAVEKSGVVKGYIGTGVTGNATGTNTTFDTTASEARKFYLSETSTTAGVVPSDLRQWQSIGYYDLLNSTEENPVIVMYNGVLDGNGKTVSGIYINSDYSVYAGLVGLLGENGTVKNISVANSFISGIEEMGGVCGISMGNVENCHNFGIVNADTDGAGGVCGNSTDYDGDANGNIKHCSNSGLVIAEGKTGGICGYFGGKELVNCYNTGTVIARGSISEQDGQIHGGTAGGICGNGKGTIKSCYNTGAVSGYNLVGGICGNYNIGFLDVSSCYYLTFDEGDQHGIQKTAEQFASGEVAWLLNGGDSQVSPLIWYQTVGAGLPAFSGNTVYCGYEDCSATDKSFSNTPLPATQEHGESFWINNNDGTHTEFCDNCYVNIKTEPHTFDANGFCTLCSACQEPNLNNNGTEDTTDDYYEIANAGQMFWFSRQVYFSGNATEINGKLVDNINLNPGYTFSFDLDTGLVAMTKGGVTIYRGTGIPGIGSGSNTTFDSIASESGRFYLNNDSAVTTDERPDGLYDWLPIGAEYRDYYTHNLISIRYLGKFDGNGKTVSGIMYFSEYEEHIGFFGLVGDTGEVKNLTIDNTAIYGALCTGGVCGINYGIISNCHNKGEVGGFNNLPIHETISGDPSIGGICGQNSGTLTECTNTGKIVSGFNIYGSSDVGGVCGINFGEITKCNNTGAVYGTYGVGGVCGYLNYINDNIAIISDCYNTGDVIGFGGDVGGVCGEAFGIGSMILRCYNTGAVFGSTYVGGICGNACGENFTIANCYNTGTVTGGDFTGGVCGSINLCIISNCYNNGDVNGFYSVGGVCGFMDGEDSIVGSCYNTGTVTSMGETESSGIIGLMINGSVYFSYYLDTSATCGIITKVNDKFVYLSPEGEAENATAEQFASGEVAWLLNTNGTDIENADYSHSNIWSQGTAYPIFADEINNAVFRVKISGAIDKAFYNKSGSTFTMPETIHCPYYTTPMTVVSDMKLTADAAITGVTPLVTDSISFAYNVTVASSLTNPTLDISFGGATVSLTATASGEGDYYNYTFVFNGILPQQMTENIAATLKIGGTAYAAKSEYSVKAYAFNRLSLSDNEIFKEFLVNMLCYGAAAQRHIGQTANLATDGLDELIGAEAVAGYRTSDTAWASLSLTTVKNVSNAGESDIIKWKSATLVFDNTITMRLYFTVPSAVVGTLDGYKFVLSSEATLDFSKAVPVSTAEEPNTYYIEITGLKPTDYSTAITVTLQNASNTAVSGTASYSVMSYIADKKNADSVKALVRALYDYGISAKAYKEST